MVSMPGKFTRPSTRATRDARSSADISGKCSFSGYSMFSPTEMLSKSAEAWNTMATRRRMGRNSFSP